MWNNNTLIDTRFVTNSQENYDILNYCVLNVTVCARVSGAPPSRLRQCFIVFMSNFVQILCTLYDFHLH